MLRDLASQPCYISLDPEHVVPHPIEKLRASLTSLAPSSFTVSEKSTQYSADEDYEFFADIDVQHAVDGFVLAVRRARDAPVNEFTLGALHRSFPEVWLGDEDQRLVITSRRNHERSS